MPYVAAARAAELPSSMAGMTPADVDVAQVHDFFTDVESIGYEDLGFAPCVELLDEVTILEGPVAHGR
jgi:hypothetical protein